MKTLNRFLIRLRNLVTGRRGDQRLREELEDYVARETEANIQAGMSEEEVGAIIQAMFFIQRIRLRNQHKEIEEGSEASNYINPAQLNELDRRILKESFKQAKRLQQRLKLDYRM